MDRALEHGINYVDTSNMEVLTAFMLTRHGRVRAPGGHLPVRHGPASSVLDLHCKAHELGNLYVVDTSFLSSLGAVSPSGAPECS